ncbi:Battenin [Chionoecetes opilio]|uniref:Battenin n=1 Tax=Chionoecetes opilio TaxID=41210 RepID=A0A8J4YT96_CHIOP|nr:Battenin [Chionoecetes opilio]KAG0730439.1 Battenin [Chionoecetes opilio]
MQTVPHWGPSMPVVTGQRRVLGVLPGEGQHWRNLLSFWLLGLTNNFAYVVMLSAAHDILSQDFSGGGGGGDDGGNGSITPANDTNTTNPRDCNTVSTGAVLLADIIPALLVKLLAPFIFPHVHLRVSVVVVMGLCSFLLVGLATSRSHGNTGRGLRCRRGRSGGAHLPRLLCPLP